MKFLDLTKVYIRSGSGGKGCTSFRREAYVEFGGPDGGDGGNGGYVWVEAVTGLNTLIDFRYQQHFFANNGQAGMGRQMSGANGDDITLRVPVGTEILDEDQKTVLADLTVEGPGEVRMDTNQQTCSAAGMGFRLHLWVTFRYVMATGGGPGSHWWAVSPPPPSPVDVCTMGCVKSCVGARTHGGCWV